MPSALHKSLARAVDKVLDPTVVLSFDQTGFRRHAVNFDPADLAVDLSGKVALVTGANGGIGKEVTRELAARGARVWMLCRSLDRGQAALDELAADPAVASAGADLHLLECDLADLDSVDRAVEALPEERVDVLVHNAGALLDDRHMTEQGLETTLSVHVVAPFRLTGLLLPRMTRRGPVGDADVDPARVIWVSSGGMYPRRLSVDRLARTTGGFDGVKAYADAKRAQVVLSEQLAARLADRGVVVNAMHPGWASTKGVQDSIPTFYAVTRRILRTPAEGADTVVWLAACARIADRTGGFWFDRRAVDTHLVPGTSEPDGERERLWAAVTEWSRLPPEIFGP